MIIYAENRFRMIENICEALDYVVKGKVQVMAETFPLEDMNSANDKVVKGESRLRAVLDSIGSS